MRALPGVTLCCHHWLESHQELLFLTDPFSLLWMNPDTAPSADSHIHGVFCGYISLYPSFGKMEGDHIMVMNIECLKFLCLKSPSGIFPAWAPAF